MTRQLVFVAALIALAGCGNTDFTARGSVVASFDGAETGFRFEQDTRLDAPSREGTLSLVTGSCEMGQVVDTVSGEPTWGVVVELRRGSTVDDNGLSSVTIMQRADADPAAGRIEAEFGTTPFQSGDACSVEVEYATADSGMVGLVGDCQVADAAGNAAQINVELDIIGCTVLE